MIFKRKRDGPESTRTKKESDGSGNGPRGALVASPASLPDHLAPAQAPSSSPSPGIEKQAALKKDKEQETMQGFGLRSVIWLVCTISVRSMLTAHNVC